jgi:hypothetical protein
VLVEDVLLEHFCSVAIELEHRRVQRQHVLGGDVAGRGIGLAGDRRHVVGQGLGRCGATAEHQCGGHGQAKASFHR